MKLGDAEWFWCCFAFFLPISFNIRSEDKAIKIAAFGNALYFSYLDYCDSVFLQNKVKFIQKPQYTPAQGIFLDFMASNYCRNLHK